jgi:hypothetical protein
MFLPKDLFPATTARLLSVRAGTHTSEADAESLSTSRSRLTLQESWKTMDALVAAAEQSERAEDDERRAPIFMYCTGEVRGYAWHLLICSPSHFSLFLSLHCTHLI